MGLAAAVAGGELGLGADVRAVARSPAVRAGLGFLAERVAAVDSAVENDGVGEGGSADEGDEDGFGVPHLARVGDGVDPGMLTFMGWRSSTISSWEFMALYMMSRKALSGAAM